MLRRLSIRNYLLIEQLELGLGQGLTVITGETGSGKSIVIGALGLAMGERVEGNLLRDPGQRCVIELEVEADAGLAFLEEWCVRNGIPEEAPMILRRQLEPGGRSRAFVNDTPVRLEQLRELGEHLVHVHSQHHTLLLNTPAFQLGLLDHSIGHATVVKDHAERFNAWRSVQDELMRQREQEAQAQSERDYLQFQFDELEAAAAEHPFEVDNPAWSYVAFLGTVPTMEQTASAQEVPTGDDEWVVLGHHLHLRYSNGMSKATLKVDALLKRLGSVGTARNLRTVQAIIELAQR